MSGTQEASSRVATLIARRGRPKGSARLETLDSAARAARLLRDGFGERAAARIVARAETPPAALARRTAKQLASDETRVRQRLDRALADVGDALGNPSSMVEVLRRTGGTCYCDACPYKHNGVSTGHSHCGWCKTCIAPGARFCYRESCYRNAFWGSPEAAEAAREEARSSKNALPVPPSAPAVALARASVTCDLDLSKLRPSELMAAWDRGQTEHGPLRQGALRGILEVGETRSSESGDGPRPK